MGGAEGNDDRTEIARMQAGIRAWVMRTASGSARGLRRIPPPALLSMLCASAFAPLISVSAGLTGAAASAGFTVLSSVSGGALSGIIASALDRTRADDGRPASASAEIEQELAGEISRILEAGDADAQALRAEIAAVLRAIDAGRTMLSAAIETGNDQVHSDVIAAVDVLGTGFAQMEFLISDVARAAAEVQQSLDEQAANVRVVVDQNIRQSADIRLVRESLGVIERRTRSGVSGGAVGDQGARWVHGCPYRGLVPFTEADAEVFYGRERMTAELVVQVARGGLLVVTGASGAGKSSLLRAGLLPALARGIQMGGSEHWPRIVITPTRHPLTELATQLAVFGGGDAVAGRASLARQPGQAHLAVRQAVLADAARSKGQRFIGRDATRLVLVVDQFEQVFTLNPGPDGEAERQAFIAALHAAATSPAGPEHEPPALVVIAVRGDFWDRCAAYPELAAALQDRHFVVGPMTETDLRLAITGPAEAAGLHIDSALTDTILSDLRAAGGDDTAGALPLLSQAMLLTWENREGSRLTSRGYGLAGGVDHAVQASADAVYDALPAEQQALARGMLRSMTVAGRDDRLTRRPVTRADLCAGRSEAERSQLDTVLEAFAAKRLVVLNDGTAEISHDALLHAWPRLRAWLEDDRASWIFHSQLTEDAAAWHDNHDDPSFLYRGTQLAGVRQAVTGWAADRARYPAITGIQHDFLNASARAAARSTRQRRILATVLVLLLIASLAGAGIAVTAARNAGQQRSIADHQRSAAASGQLAAESEAQDVSDPITASQLAAAAWRIAPTPQARVSMLDVLAQPERGVLSASQIYSLGSVAFSPDGNLLATGSFSGTVRLWDVATRRPVGASIRAGNANDEVSAVAFSPDGKILATAAIDGTVRLWGVASRRPIGVPMAAGTPSTFGVRSVAFSPDGTILATGNGEGIARLWDVASRRPIGVPMATGTANTGGPVSVAFSPDGTILATGNGDGIARLWDVATYRAIGASMRAGPVGRGPALVAFSPDGKILATANGLGTTRLWDVVTQQQTGAPLAPTLNNCDGGVFGLVFSPDGKTLATADCDGTARLWDIAIYHQAGGHFGGDQSGGLGPSSLAFSPSGTVLATAGRAVRLWNVATHHQIGKPVAGARVFRRCLSRIIQCVIHRKRTGNRVFSGVAFSPDGKILAIALQSQIQLWDVATRRQIGAALPSGPPGLQGLTMAFNPSGTILATAGSQVRLWNVATHHQIGKPVAVARDSGGVAFSPDGKTLAIGRAFGPLQSQIQLWDVATRRLIGAALPSGPPGPQGLTMAFNHSGTILATAGSQVRLWNVATHHQIGAPIIAGGQPVNSVAFSPDGTILATADDDNTARLWDVATHQQIGAPMAAGTLKTGSVSAVAFSPDGKTLATDNGTAILWDVGFPSDPLSAVCAIAGRSLSHQQWNTYIQSEPFHQACP